MAHSITIPAFIAISFICNTAFSQKVEQYTVFKLEKKIGVERVAEKIIDGATLYQITSVLNDRGTKQKLVTSLLARGSFPIRYNSSGSISRFETENILLMKIAPDRFPLSKSLATPLWKMLIDFWKDRGEPQKILSAVDSVPIYISFLTNIQLPLSNTNSLLYSIRYSSQEEILWLNDSGEVLYNGYCDNEGDKVEVVNDEALFLFEFFKRATDSLLLVNYDSSVREKIRSNSVLAITNCRYLNIESGMYIANALIVVRDGLIEFAGDYDANKIPRCAMIVEANRKYVIPGLWDMHAHLFSPWYMMRELASGVTTVRDAGNEFDLINSLGTYAMNGGIAPSIIKAGLIEGNSEIGLSIAAPTSEYDISKLITKYYDSGFSQIKIYSQVKKRNISKVRAACDRLGMTVAGHIPDGLIFNTGIREGIQFVSHIHYIQKVFGYGASQQSKRRNENLLKEIKEKRVVIDPTMNAYNLTGDNATRIHRMLLKWLYQNSIPIVAGTDNVGLISDELAMYVESGIPPLDAIRLASVVPARVMGRYDRTGSIAIGKSADLLILNSDPLKDIKNLKDVYFVQKGRMSIFPSER